ncbi:MAG: hypothetical protein L0Z53_02250 [Acidobacteriales bacterium]|nr:hypothetical protein [Terriglobales bacterium]
MRKLILLLALLAPLPLAAQSFEAPRQTDKPFHILTAVAFSSAVADVETTQALRAKLERADLRHVEYNPLARPFVKHRAVQYAAWSATAGGASWLGWKMKRSRKGWIRRIWWLPQVAVIGANTWGTTQNFINLRKR